MIAQLSDLSTAAQPTSFHNVLRALDDRGRLLRVYTQNIDAIEQKSGLSFGVPDFDDKRYRTRSKGKVKAVAETAVTEDNGPIASTSRLPSPPVETPRCIPLHGTLQSMHCQICNRSFPLLDYLSSLSSGQPPPCPECTSLEATRHLVGKRPRGIGRLRPSVVLYNEAHKDGEGVGDVVQKDLIGSSKGKGRSGADLLLVVGTSLRVPGTKRMVREFAKAVRSRGTTSSSPSKDENTSTPSSSSRLATPLPSPRRSPTAEEEVNPKAIYLNLDFPVPTREWEGVFDAWIQGDAQQFAELLHAEIEKEARAKEIAVKKKQKKDEEAAAQAYAAEHEMPDYGRMEHDKNTYTEDRHRKIGQNSVKRKHNNSRVVDPKTPDCGVHLSSSGKRRKTTLPPSPPYTPPSPSRRAPSPTEEEKDEDEIIDVEALSPRPSKLLVRIPAGRTRPYFVPEVYIRSKAPHYVRPRQFSFSTPIKESYVRTKSPSHSPKDEDSKMDDCLPESDCIRSLRYNGKKQSKAASRQTAARVSLDNSSSSSLSSSSASSSYLKGGDNQGHHCHHRKGSNDKTTSVTSSKLHHQDHQYHRQQHHSGHSRPGHAYRRSPSPHSLPSPVTPTYGRTRARSGSSSSSSRSRLGGLVDHGHLSSRTHQLGI